MAKNVDKSQTQELEVATKFTPAPVVGVNTKLAISTVDLPEEFQGAQAEVLETGFAPTVKWVKPGNYVVGVYQGLSEDAGPNHSRLYHFETKTGKEFGVWGTTVLDRAFDSGIKSKLVYPGRLMLIAYVADLETDLNPCKMFHIQLAKKD